MNEEYDCEELIKKLRERISCAEDQISSVSAWVDALEAAIKNAPTPPDPERETGWAIVLDCNGGARHVLTHAAGFWPRGALPIHRYAWFDDAEAAKIFAARFDLEHTFRGHGTVKVVKIYNDTFEDVE